MEAETFITAYLHSEPHRCRIVVADILLYREQHYRVCLFLPDGQICEYTGATIIGALAEIRRVIEPRGWRLGINAARYDAVRADTFNDVFVFVPSAEGAWEKVCALGEASLGVLADLDQQESYLQVLRRAQLEPPAQLMADRERWWELMSQPALTD
jgi:hypothetical protein